MGYTLPLVREPLTLQDRVFGEVHIHEPLLLDLIRLPAFQRLKNILQHGISALVTAELATGNQQPVSRFEHCVGAAVIIRELGGTVEEQCAALLHDVSHTALSHVLDKVFGAVVHETEKHLFLARNPDIAAVIEAHGYCSERIFDEENFSLLERNPPRLCADRTDYGLRDSRAFGLLSQEQCQEIFQSFVVHDGEICCRDVKTARFLSETYMQADTMAWSNPFHGALYEYTADAIREAFDDGRVDSLRDAMWTQDCSTFWSAIVASPQESVRRKAARVRPDLVVTELKEGEPLGHGEELLMKLKPRVLDPTVVLGDGRPPRQLSELDDEFRAKVESYKLGKHGLKRFRVEVAA